MTPADFSVFLFDRIPPTRQFEDRLWEAADNLRANAKLKANEYAAPLLGLFFLRYASNRFNAITPQAAHEFAATQNKRNSETIEEVYKRLCGFYLPEQARYETLLNLKGEDNAQQAVIDAMEAFEKANKDDANPSANITLPKNDYRKIPDIVLRGIIGTIAEVKVSEGDGFGKIYEYFLGKFALSEGQKGGEFYTPTSVVKLIVEVIEPFKTDARVFDPACGTGGMFVQSAKFVEQHTGLQQLSLYGQEKVTETANLGKLNLFVHGLKGDIRNVDNSLDAATYQDDYADTAGKFDFVMANPPFNVDGIKVEAVGSHPLFAAYGLPLSTAKTGKKADTFSNANYLWISLFATALNRHGRAGFVMANSASDARGGEAEVRQRLVEAGLVDVMITLASNFFYTVTLPVTLWFFDRAKTNPRHQRHDQTLFIDARKIFHQVTRAHREFTQAQLLNLAAIVWLYRGETEKFAALRRLYERARETWHNETVSDQRDEESVSLGRNPTWRGWVAQQESLAESCRALGETLKGWFAQIEAHLSDEAKAALAENAAWQASLAALAEITAAQLPDKAAINEFSKQAEDAVNFADKQLRPDKDKTFNKADVRGALRRLNEARDAVLFVLERIAYFDAQLAWLDTHFPDGVWRDVEGLCRIARRADIAEQQFSLNPGRYVGVSVEDDGMTAADFQGYMQASAASLATLHQEADELQRLIAQDLQGLFV
jgi:type I restriction enzyme M protein